jgi:glycosyltransferase involved in cell wall biosynthesis
VRVVHLVSTLEVGGLEKVVVDLVTRRNRSIEASVICLEHAGPLARDIEAAGATVEVLGDDASRATRLRRLVHRMRARRPDVLHTHNPAPHLIGAAAARIARVPVVVHTKHGRNYPGRPARVWLNRQLARFTDTVVAVSDDVADVCRGIECVPANRVRVIRNGVDTSRFAGVRATAPATRALSVGRLHPIKDHATLLHAVRVVADAEPDFHLDIVGDGVCRPSLEALAAQLHLEHHVTFHGERDDVRTFLARAGLFVLASTSEGVSLTLLEAMAVGLPIVATRVGGNPEVVTDGETGLLTRPRDPRAFADAVLHIVADSARARAMGEAGMRRARTHFDVADVVDSYERLYWQLLEEHA